METFAETKARKKRICNNEDCPQSIKKKEARVQIRCNKSDADRSCA